jgi:NitT/TauT family transport system permease protein
VAASTEDALLPTLDTEPARRPALDRLGRIAAPLLIGLLVLLGWEALVRLRDIPPYILPAPTQIGAELVASWVTLFPSLLVTLKISSLALLAAVTGGGGLSIL